MDINISNFELMRDKDILSILDGDIKFEKLRIEENDEEIEVSMPYLSGPAICNMSKRFGLNVLYNMHETQSRWKYMDDLMVHCIQNKCESELLNFLFSKEHFTKKLKGLSGKVIEDIYVRLVDSIIDHINGILYCKSCDLIKVGSTFIVRKPCISVTVSAPAIKKIDRSYITDLSERAMKDIADGNYDSAITKSRTLLEEVFCYVIEIKGETPSDGGDVGKLYGQVKNLYNMHQNKDMDKRINGLLSGLEKILAAIIEMRNKGSDSHGIGARRINISDYHTRLFVNSAMTMADFILSVSENVK